MGMLIDEENIEICKVFHHREPELSKLMNTTNASTVMRTSLALCDNNAGYSSMARLSFGFGPTMMHDSSITVGLTQYRQNP